MHGQQNIKTRQAVVKWGEGWKRIASNYHKVKHDVSRNVQVCCHNLSVRTDIRDILRSTASPPFRPDQAISLTAVFQYNTARAVGCWKTNDCSSTTRHYFWRKLRISLRSVNSGRCQWLCGLRCGSAAARLLGLRVRVPPGACKPVSCDCNV
jgi:hypothetical protein